jgi:hypothetical protein
VLTLKSEAHRMKPVADVATDDNGARKSILQLLSGRDQEQQQE